jgi:D-sedoheptulose 7-phosphate isomerase
MKERIRNLIEDSIRVKERLIANATDIVALVECVIAVLRKGGVVYVFGNGGSAADAQHIAAELSGRFLLDRRSLPAIALTTNTSTLTAVANDYGFEEVFSRQLEGLITKKDIAIGITTSGKSRNVIKALKLAREKGSTTAALVGEYAKEVINYCDVVVSVPSNNTARVQECHILIGHIVCELVEKELFKNVKLR